MITESQVKELISNMESDRIERTLSIREDKLGPAICAFSNDFARNNQPGYILLGVQDDGKIANIKWSDEQIQTIGNLKSNGKILPQPSISISSVFQIDEGEIIVIEVQPSPYPPVRFDGRCWIRLGPRRSIASVEEERILTERRASFAKTYDLLPALGTSLKALDLDAFRLKYLPAAIDPDTLAENGRSIEQQLASLRFYDLNAQTPTNAGILLLGKNPEFTLPGAYIQYIKFAGDSMLSDVIYEKKFTGALIYELKVLDDFIKGNIIKERPVKKDSFQEELIRNYPYWALRELLMNAIMHRNYESNAPIYIYEYAEHIEIVNPGGLFGEATPQNFPNASDYRNIVVAESLRILGFVNRFNYGVKRAIHELLQNGNGEPEFDLTLQTKFKVNIKVRKDWLK